MILLGAGASAPLGIPTMEGFVRRFEGEIKGDTEIEFLYEDIKRSIIKSEESIDVALTFDLESLMAVLEDISGIQEKRTVSLPTFAFLLSQFKEGKLKSLAVKEAREIFGENGRKMLKKLRSTIFNVCMEPILKGEREGSHAALAKYFGPLFALFSRGRTISSWVSWIFTTNWDLCLKVWMNYIPWPYEDGTIHDPQKKTVFDPTNGWTGKESGVFSIVPLHGDLDFIKVRVLRVGGDYEEIEKVANPHVYFEDKPGEIEKIFMIYPLEAVGYEQSVRSPYLDMLNRLKEKLRSEAWIFVIGFSFRDPTIASIFEEVLRERVRKKDWKPLSLDLSERAGEARDTHLKFFLIDSSPEKILNNLEKQGFVNIQKACIPIQVKFPYVYSDKFEKEFSHVLAIIAGNLRSAGMIETGDLNKIINELNEEYQLYIPTFEG